MVIYSNNFLSSFEAFNKLNNNLNNKFIILSSNECIENIKNGNGNLATLIVTDYFKNHLMRMHNNKELYLEHICSSNIGCVVGKNSKLYNKDVIYKQNLKDKINILPKEYKGNLEILADLNIDNISKTVFIDSLFDAVPILNNEDSVLLGGIIKSPFLSINNLKMIRYGSSNTMAHYLLIKKTPCFTKNEEVFKEFLYSKLKKHYPSEMD